MTGYVAPPPRAPENMDINTRTVPDSPLGLFVRWMVGGFTVGIVIAAVVLMAVT